MVHKPLECCIDSLFGPHFIKPLSDTGQHIAQSFTSGTTWIALTSRSAVSIIWRSVRSWLASMKILDRGSDWSNSMSTIRHETKESFQCLRNCTYRRNLFNCLLRNMAVNLYIAPHPSRLLVPTPKSLRLVPTALSGIFLRSPHIDIFP